MLISVIFVIFTAVIGGLDMAKVKLHEVGGEFYLLRSSENELHRNIYFKRFTNSGKTVNMIMDPGTKLDADSIITASKELFGGIQQIDIIFLSHQDPDVSSLVPMIMASAPKSILVTSVDTFRLVKMYGIAEERVKLIENFRSEVLSIKSTGHRVRFIPAYYCHFRGAMMFYDYQSKVLFTGDFMAGVNTRKGEGIYATEDSWQGIEMFHTIYMPGNKPLKETVDRIGLLNPIPSVLAPQHGDVVKGELVFEFLSRLYNLDVGIDYMLKLEPQKELVINAIESFRERIKENYPTEYGKIREAIMNPGEFTSVFVFSGDHLTDIKIEPDDAIRYLVGVIEKSVTPDLVPEIKTYLMLELETHNVATSTAIFTKLQSSKDEKVSLDSLLEDIF